MEDTENYISTLFTQQACCMVLINERMIGRICDPNEENSAEEVLLGELRLKREPKRTIACHDVN
jgi:hypothetical protein